MPTDDALWMRRNLTWIEIAQEYGVDPNWLTWAVSKRGFKRNNHGVLLVAPCKECGACVDREKLEPYRVCPTCRPKKYMDEPWWAEYQEARQNFLRRMAQLGLRSGDLAYLSPPSP